MYFFVSFFSLATLFNSALISANAQTIYCHKKGTKGFYATHKTLKFLISKGM